VVGDDPAELERALAEGLTYDLLCVTGGLGPTHDDRTMELLARAAGVGVHVDMELEAEIGSISRGIASRLGRTYADFAEGVQKQATVPVGSFVVGIAGTAPAIVLQTRGGVAVALPGPPRELRELWPIVLRAPALRRLLARAVVPGRRVLRFYGLSESALAQAFAEAGGDGDGVTATICARDFELVTELYVDPGAERRAAELERRLVDGAGERYLFARDDEPTAALVLRLLRERGLSLATAESCTGGLVAARLTDVPGSSDVFVGSVVAYADEVKAAALGVREAVLREHGAVSAETAAAMAAAARARLGADVAVAVTGVAGPGGGSPDKPVGLVFLHAVGPDGARSRRLELGGDRETVRARAAAAALHLIRTLVTKA